MKSVNNEKIDNLMNLVMDANAEERSKSEALRAGFNAREQSWELIVRYTGNLDFLEQYPEVETTLLSNNFAILKIPERWIDTIAQYPEIIYMEKPKPLYFQVVDNRRESCVSAVQNQSGLYGKGVLVAVIDSGIDLFHRVFLDDAGNTRVRFLWDQTVNTGSPPEDFPEGSEYDATQIDRALRAASIQERYEIVPSRDNSGHGTHVAGIAAGNFAAETGNDLGIATQSELLIVKLKTAPGSSFATTVELMGGIEYVTRKAQMLRRPLVINLSFGNNYGSHDGTSLLETYLNEIGAREQICVVVGTGNEGNSGGHTEGRVRTGETRDVEISVSEYQPSFNLQLWKSYADIFLIEILSPSGQSTGVFTDVNEVMKYAFPSGNTRLLVYYGMPRPYSQYQEIYVEFLALEAYVQPGIWSVRITSVKSAVGEYNCWLPVEASLAAGTRFRYPTADTTLTIPSTASGMISVGAYDSQRETYADFSGRGFTRETGQIKPDLVAPGVNIVSAQAGGGVAVRTGTSMATPFVSGAAALLMEWGLVRGNDRYLYGEKLKAYLLRGARQLPGEATPSKKTGYGALCLRDSFPL